MQCNFLARGSATRNALGALRDRFPAPALRRNAILATGLLASAAFLAPAARADVVYHGYGLDAANVVPGYTSLAAHDTLSNGNRVVYDGSQIWIETATGAFVQLLDNPTASQFLGFVEVDPTETFAVFGETSQGRIFRVPLSGGTSTQLTVLPLAYDLAFESGTSAIVSAAVCDTGFTTCTNYLVRLDLVTGATQTIATIDGPSGPVAFTPSGDLLVGKLPTAFFVPPDTCSLLRFSAAQLASGPFPLSESSATLFTPNLDGAASVAVDAVTGSVFLAEGTSSGTSNVLEIDRLGTVVGAVASTADYLTKVEVLDAPGDGGLAGFQPQGRKLLYRTTNFGGPISSTISTVSPRRPVLTSVQNGNGTMTCTLTGGRPNTAAYVISGNAWQYAASENSYPLGTYLLWTGMPYPDVRRAGIQFPLDSTGTGSFTFNNPAPIQGLFVLQALVRDASGTFRGASTAAFN